VEQRSSGGAYGGGAEVRLLEECYGGSEVWHRGDALVVRSNS